MRNSSMSLHHYVTPVHIKKEFWLAACEEIKRCIGFSRSTLHN